MKKKALGKGLKAFLPDDYGILKEERYTELEIDRLAPNPHQPRMNFKEEAIEELAQSIKETGVLQPLVVVPGENDYFYIVVGERRWRAAQKIGLRLPVIIRKLSKAQQLEASLVENLQREDLNPLEVALAYQKMIDELSYTQQEVAEKVGKDRASVTNYLRLLKLPPEIKAFLMEGQLTMGHARALLALEETDLQIALARKIIKQGLSVREVEKLIQKMKAQPSSPKKETPTPSDPDLLAAQEELIQTLGTKVAISGTLKKGVIKIYYYSTDDLNRVFDKIKGAK